MTTPVRVGGFVVVLAVLFGAAFGIGRLADDDDEAPEASVHAHGDYRMVLVGTAEPEPGRGTLTFRVEDSRGDVVTDFEVRHEKRLHLIAVDTGYSGYQHLHPTMAADGTWSTPIEVATGQTRLYADFAPVGGDATVATAQLRVRGPVGSPAWSPLRTQRLPGDYTVTLLGDLTTGGTSDLRFEIGRNGVPVDDLQPYLGAYGHLVAIRADDGAYEHVHPEDGPAGPEISFVAEVTKAGRYHLYLDFRHGGVVRTAHFVVDATAGARQQEGMDHGDH